MVYNLRSHGALPAEGAPEEEDVQAESDEWEDEEDDDDDDDTIENDPFYQPYLQNENLTNLGRILRYELERMEHLLLTELGEDEDDEEAPPVENTRVVQESEVSLPQTETLVVETPPVPPTTSSDPDKLCPADFEGLPRYRLSFMCVRYFEWTGIRNIATASSISNDALMRALCQIPRGRVVPDCAICSYPLWDALETKCCSQPLCIHCVNRCAECPFCRSADY